MCKFGAIFVRDLALAISQCSAWVRRRMVHRVQKDNELAMQLRGNFRRLPTRLHARASLAGRRGSDSHGNIQLPVSRHELEDTVNTGRIHARMTSTSGHSPQGDAPVEIIPYDPLWPSKFEAERVLLQALLARWLTGPIEHVGSTAIPGMAAKLTLESVRRRKWGCS